MVFIVVVIALVTFGVVLIVVDVAYNSAIVDVVIVDVDVVFTVVGC